LNEKRYEYEQETPCAYQEILPVLSSILENRLVALNKGYRQEFVTGNCYYIYSNVKESAIELLRKDAATH